MTPQQLLALSACFNECLSSPGVMLYLLDQLRIQGGGSAMTMQEIMTAANCYNCIPDQAAAQTYMLNEILEAL